MNPFETKEWIDLVDNPSGRRVLLDCQKCGTIVIEGKYYPKHKMLSWKCNECQFISKQEIDLGE